MGVEEAHSLVALLTTPLDSSTQDNDWLVGTVRSKVQQYGARLQGSVLDLGSSEDVYFDYVRCCVHALMTLKLELKLLVEQEREVVGQQSGPKLAVDTLSIAQAKSAGSVVQMVVALGLLPNLLPGVGLAADKRSSYLQDVLRTVPERSVLEKYKQLVFSLEALLDLSKTRSFSTLVTTKHITDIIGCLVQICHAPLMKPSTPEPVAETDMVDGMRDISAGVEGIQVKEEAFVMTGELHGRLAQDQDRFRVELDRILGKTYQPLVVKSLLVLQSSSKTAKAPKWFVKTVGQLLTSRLVAEGGVMAVVRGVLDLGGEGEGCDWKQVNLVAEVLGNPPQGRYQDTERYYALVCPQLLEMLASNESPVAMIACSSIKTVSERSLMLSRRYLLEPLFRPLLALAGSEQEALGLTEQGLDEAVKNLFKVFVIGNDPNLMFVANLEPVILVLMNLYLSLAFGISHLKDPVKQLIERYLKHSDRSTSVAVMRAFALNEMPKTNMNRAQMMNADIAFVNGDEGGLKPIAKVNSEQSFYVSDDEKSIVVQDILEDIKDKRLATEFFLSLLEDLTVAMIDDDLEIQEPEMPDIASGGDVEQQLLELERQLDATMHKMRRNLMVIRLLGLLSEDNNFQENLLKESDKMIQFVSSSIKRAALGVAAGVASSVMAVQSLNMALSILSVHLTQQDVPMDDWEKMLASTADLKILEDHADDRIAKISGQLYNLITTQGIVVEEVKLLKANTKKIQEETEKLRAKADQVKAVQKDQENQTLDEKKAQLKAKADDFKKQKELRKKKAAEPKSAYEAAMYDVSDPLVPVQGHGLICLTRLLGDKDAETLDNTEKIRQLFMANLEDSDTYLYLSAINGLVASARYSPELVLEALCREFGLVQDRKMEVGEEQDQQEEVTVQLRTKVGEALVQIVRELGELAPKYKNLLVNSFFSAATDTDPMVRCSALSNLGEVCSLLRFSLGSITAEVLLHLAASARDHEAGVRAAAVLTLTLILRGLGRDMFRVLQHSLRDIYRGLKLMNGVEKDETVLCHIGLALAEIDTIMRNFLTPDTAVEKKIYVLDSPPDCF